MAVVLEPSQGALETLAFLDGQVTKLKCENSRSMASYYRLFTELHRQGEYLLAEEDLERSYVVLKKYCTLFLVTMSEHNAFHSKTFAKEKADALKKVDVAWATLKDLKTALLIKYEGATLDDTDATDAVVAATELGPTVAVVVPAAGVPGAGAGAGARASDSKTNSYGAVTPTTGPNSKWDNLRGAPTPTAAATPTPKAPAAAVAGRPGNVAAAGLYAAMAPSGGGSNAPKALPPGTKPPGGVVARAAPTPTAGAAAAAKPKRKAPPLPKHLFDAKRQLILPATLMQQFQAVAAPNTAANVETCGILCGRIDGGDGKSKTPQRLIVSHCIIPEQHGTSDTCVTAGEEALFSAQDKHSLITFGWIHTHPSQSCFLSSIDMHTQFSYQIMLPEAVAIVLAPSYVPNTGCFSMTAKGMQVLSVRSRRLPSAQLQRRAVRAGHARAVRRRAQTSVYGPPRQHARVAAARARAHARARRTPAFALMRKRMRVCRGRCIPTVPPVAPRRVALRVDTVKCTGLTAGVSARAT